MIKPINDKLVIKKIEPKTKTEGGLHLHQAVELTKRGEVVAIDNTSVPYINVGDIVTYIVAGVPFKIKNEEYVFLEIKAVWGYDERESDTSSE